MGSISRVGDQRYRLRVEKAPDPETGKRRWHSEVCQGTRKDCEKRLAKLTLEPGEMASRELMREYITERWLPYYQATYRASSYRQRRVIMERWWLPVLGDVPLAALSGGQIQREIAGLRGKGLSAQRARDILAVLKAALAQAVRWELLPRNPAEHIRLAAVRETERAAIWTPAQYRCFLAKQEGMWRVFWLTLGGTGMRLGEARALRWSDVDWETPAIAVRRTWARGDAGEYLDRPKSDAGRREIKIGVVLLETLRSWRASQATARWGRDLPADGDGFVFAREDGTAVPAESIYYRWRAGIAAAGVPRAKIHDLRHLAVSEQLAAGVPMKIVSARIGHSSLKLTSDLYGHVRIGHQEEAARVLDALITGPDDEMPRELRRG